VTRKTTGRTPRRWKTQAGGRHQAFSTGQAARYCFVTADTIVNWINGGTLQAQRTAGGQYRIRLDDLYDFMLEHGMSTELLEAERDVRPHCWEFHCAGELSPTCQTCLTYRSGAMQCFELRECDSSGAHLFSSCGDCEYHRRYAVTEDLHGNP
jgi:excisionase family DNA binding protein